MLQVTVRTVNPHQLRAQAVVLLERQQRACSLTPELLGEIVDGEKRHILCVLPDEGRDFELTRTELIDSSSDALGQAQAGISSGHFSVADGW